MEKFFVQLLLVIAVMQYVSPSPVVIVNTSDITTTMPNERDTSTVHGDPSLVLHVTTVPQYTTMPSTTVGQVTSDPSVLESTTLTTTVEVITTNSVDDIAMTTTKVTDTTTLAMVTTTKGTTPADTTTEFQELTTTIPVEITTTGLTSTVETEEQTTAEDIKTTEAETTVSDTTDWKKLTTTEISETNPTTEISITTTMTPNFISSFTSTLSPTTNPSTRPSTSPTTTNPTTTTSPSTENPSTTSPTTSPSSSLSSANPSRSSTTSPTTTSPSTTSPTTISPSTTSPTTISPSTTSPTTISPSASSTTPTTESSTSTTLTTVSSSTTPKPTQRSTTGRPTSTTKRPTSTTERPTSTTERSTSTTQNPTPTPVPTSKTTTQVQTSTQANVTAPVPGPQDGDNLAVMVAAPVASVLIVLVIVAVVLFVCCHGKRGKRYRKYIKRPKFGLLASATVDDALDTGIGTTGQTDTHKVLYTYISLGESEISLTEGQLVRVVEEDGTGWSKVRFRDEEGWFPGNYLKKIQKDGVQNIAFVTEESVLASSPSAVQHNFKSERMFKVLHPYTGIEDGELNLTEGDVVTVMDSSPGGWMWGITDVSGEEGWFPADYVEEIFEDGSEHDDSCDYSDPYEHLKLNHQEIDDSNSTKDILGIEHKVICQFTAEQEHDMSLAVGDIIVVLDTLPNGWWFGCHGNRQGWFPGAYVEITDERSPNAPHTPAGYELLRFSFDSKTDHSNITATKTDSAVYSYADSDIKEVSSTSRPPSSSSPRPLSSEYITLISDADIPKPETNTLSPPSRSSDTSNRHLNINTRKENSNTLTRRPVRPAPPKPVAREKPPRPTSPPNVKDKYHPKSPAKKSPWKKSPTEKLKPNTPVPKVELTVPDIVIEMSDMDNHESKDVKGSQEAQSSQVQSGQAQSAQTQSDVSNTQLHTPERVVMVSGPQLISSTANLEAFKIKTIERKKKSKPDVPARWVKPKLVKVPTQRVKRSLGVALRPVNRPPPPPRPLPPDPVKLRKESPVKMENVSPVKKSPPKRPNPPKPTKRTSVGHSPAIDDGKKEERIDQGSENVNPFKVKLRHVMGDENGEIEHAGQDSEYKSKDSNKPVTEKPAIAKKPVAAIKPVRKSTESDENSVATELASVLAQRFKNKSEDHKGQLQNDTAKSTNSDSNIQSELDSVLSQRFKNNDKNGDQTDSNATIDLAATYPVPTPRANAGFQKRQVLPVKPQTAMTHTTNGADSTEVGSTKPQPRPKPRNLDKKRAQSLDLDILGENRIDDESRAAKEPKRMSQSLSVDDSSVFPELELGVSAIQTRPSRPPPPRLVARGQRLKSQDMFKTV